MKGPTDLQEALKKAGKEHTALALTDVRAETWAGRLISYCYAKAGKVVDGVVKTVIYEGEEYALP